MLKSIDLQLGFRTDPKFHPPYNYLTTNNLQTPFLAIFSIQIDATNGELLKE
ncbi:MAG: hypothetical protein HXN63_08830 [Prevotella pallens]|nr:hypothetical protein [Prevotella pallens]